MNKALGWVIKSVGAFFVLLTPINAVLAIVFGLVVGDFCLGLLAARARKEKIVSVKMKRTVSKILAYEIAILIGFMLQSGLELSWPVVHTVSMVIVLSESASLLENFRTITGIDVLNNFINSVHKLKSINVGNEKK